MDKVSNQYLRQGNEFKRSGDLNEALMCYKNGIFSNPTFHWFYHFAGEVLAKIGKLDEAIEHYQKAIKLYPNSPWHHYELGILLERQNKTREAVKSYSIALDLKPEITVFHRQFHQAQKKVARKENTIYQPDESSLKVNYSASSYKIINFHRTDCNNIGDIVSSPLLYYDFPGEVEEIDIMKISGEKYLENANIIVGGGGLISCDFFERKMRLIAEKKRAKAILWGAGHNDWQISDAKFSYPDYIKKFDLIGLRDYNQDLEYDYVPCVSCKSHWFDIKYEVKFEFAIFGHGAPMRVKEILNVASQIDNPQFAFITNRGTDDATFGKIIRVLGEAEVILTNSYHGMYWGILLGKKVLVFPSSSKFYSLKYGAEICDASNWKLKLNTAMTYPEALQECRFFNDKFYEKFLDVICT